MYIRTLLCPIASSLPLSYTAPLPIVPKPEKSVVSAPKILTPYVSPISLPLTAAPYLYMFPTCIA